MLIVQGFKQEVDSFLYIKHKDGFYAFILPQVNDLILDYERQMDNNSVVSA